MRKGNLLQGLIDESYKQFTEAVAEGEITSRRSKKICRWKNFHWIPSQRIRFVDEVGDEFMVRELSKNG